jgi:phage terminase large subunit-like protein
MSLPRGQGKSTLLAALALWALFCPVDEGTPSVPVVAATVGQAIRGAGVYGVALRMVALEGELRERCITYSAIGAMRIHVPSNGGDMFPVSSDPAGLQGLDPSFAVADEIGFLSVQSWDSLLLAGGKRPRSLIVAIGTPGFDRTNALYHLRSRVTEGAVLPGFSFTEYAAPEGCDVRDETAWRAANPAIRERFLDVGALRSAVELSPEAHFRTFRLGQWVDGIESWLGADGRKTWEALADPYELEPGADTWAGVDVALKHDSSAVAIVQARPDGRLHVKVRVWFPPRSGDGLDVTDVMKYLRDLAGAYRLREISYDPRFFDVPARLLTDEGLRLVEIPQSVERMTPACGRTLEAIQRREISHDGDPVFAEHVLNAVTRYNDRGFTLSKGRSRGKIDACIAMVLALDRAQQPARREPQIF